MKQFLLCSFLSLLAFTSCKNESTEEVELTDSQKLVGTWKISKYVVISGKTNTAIIEQDATNCEKSSTFQYSGNAFTFKTFGGAGTTCAAGPIITGSYKYNTSTKILTLTLPDNTSSFVQIITLESNVLSILDDVSDFDGDGIDDRYLTYFTK